MMKFCLLNARNITGKLTEFSELVSDHGGNCIFAATETWFTDSDITDAWSVDAAHFKIFTANRNFAATSRVKGGGVMLLIPKFLNPKIRTDLCDLSQTFETLWVECNSPCAPKDRILINVSYCPHKHLVDTFFEQLASDVSAAYNEGKEVLLFGDYNCNYLNSQEAQKITDLLSNLDLHIVNNDTPTRIGENSKTLIDHFFCNNPRNFMYRVTEPNFPTDHCLSTFVLNSEVKRSCVAKSYFKFSKKNYAAERFSHDLSTKDWSHVYRQNSADSMLSTFEKIFLETLLKHAPFKKCFRKDSSKCKAEKKPWITENVKMLINDKHSLHKKYLDSPSAENRKLFNQSRNLVNRELKRAHEAYTKQQFERLSSTRRRWAYINNARGVSKETGMVPALCNSFGELTTDSKKDCGPVQRQILISW